MSTPPKVLVVEDEQHLADGLRFNLEAEGYDADVVDSGEGALERLLGSPRDAYDLVILDVMLPGKAGVDSHCTRQTGRRAEGFCGRG